ncbi:MAG: hypothetical protein AAB453_04330 [Patescibacteria group bacterium]
MSEFIIISHPSPSDKTLSAILKLGSLLLAIPVLYRLISFLYREIFKKQ